MNRGMVNNHLPKENLARWIATGEPERWVRKRWGEWDESDWLSLVKSLKRSEFWVMEEGEVRRTLEVEKKKWQCEQAGGHNHKRLNECWECTECGKRHFPPFKDWLIANYSDSISKSVTDFDLGRINDIRAAQHHVGDFLANQGVTGRQELNQKYEEAKSRFLYR
jgi:hypothetical protein